MKTRVTEEGKHSPSSPRLAGGSKPEHDSADLLGAFWRYRWAVIVPALLGAVGGFLAYLQTEETYRSTTRLMLETDRPAILDQMTGDLVGGVPSIEIVESQLYSDQVVQMAFDDLRMQPHRDFFGGDVEQYNKFVQKSMLLEPEVSDNQTAQSLVMLLHFDSHHPELCEASVRAFSSALRQFFDEREKDSQADLISWIRDSMNELQPRIQELEQQYRDFRRDAPLAWDSAGEAINPHRERQLFLVERRSEILEQLRQKQILLGAVESVADQSGDPMVALGVVSQLLGVQIQIPEKEQRDTTQQARDGDAILAEIDVDKELIPLMIERNKYANEFGDNHPTVKQLDGELSLMKAELKRLVKEESDRIVKIIQESREERVDPAERAKEAIAAVLYAAKSEIQLLESQIEEVDKQIEDERAGSIQLAKYEQENMSMLREIDRTRELMDQLQEQMARVELTDEQTGSTRVIELKAPTRAYLVGPVLIKLLAIGTMLGLVAGSGLALLLEKNASTFRTPDEISDVLGVPVLTHVPYFKGNTRRGKKEEPGPLDKLDPQLAVLHQPASIVSEAIRSFRTSVFFELPGPRCNVIQVTSPLPGDGKSTIASNLACSIAQSGKRVLAIDCDLRRPQLTDSFAMAEALGLTDVLNGECEPHEATHETPLPHLDVMPSGPIPANPAEALTLPDMQELLQYLREHYDYIIVDTPPLLVVTDPSIIASMVDGVVLALQIRRKSKHNSAESVNILRGVGANLLGVVINNSDESGVSDGYRGYGYYRYGRYTTRYHRANQSGSSSRRESVVVAGRKRPLTPAQVEKPHRLKHDADQPYTDSPTEDAPTT